MDKDARFQSSLAQGGEASWSCQDVEMHPKAAGSRHCVAARLDVDFPQINWSDLQAVYGWAALQVRTRLPLLSLYVHQIHTYHWIQSLHSLRLQYLAVSFAFNN